MRDSARRAVVSRDRPLPGTNGMTPEDFGRIRDLFDRAMSLPGEDRREFVDRHAPSGDPIHAQLAAMVELGDDSAVLAGALEAGVLDKTWLRDPNLPKQIGPYRILRVLGRGGMGVVYLALRNDDVFRKVVALKVIGSVGDSAGIDLVARFKQERQILAGLDHPNIARILDGGSTTEGRPFYVMEYVDGSPIDQYCARMNIDLPTRVRMMAQACDAIDYLHKQAIAHRDIKPQNILVTLDGRVKLVDFGIAKVEAAGGLNGSPSSGAPTMIMTPGYASPEQIAGQGSGKTGDIYSVAVVLYQLLTGRLPYVDERGRPNVTAQLSGALPDPPSHELAKKQTPRTAEIASLSLGDLDRVVLTALQRDPLQRYASVELFGEDLRRCLAGRAIAAHPASAVHQIWKVMARNKVAAAIIALVVLGAVGTWLAAGIRTERVALHAKEAELERFITLLDAKVARWQQDGLVVPALEKIADVQSANRMMASEAIRSLSERAPDPPRVKRLMADLGRVLDRADRVVRDEPSVRKEIALVFRRIGDFEKDAPLPRIADKAEAVRSYQRAAGIAADIRSAEQPWADRQLAELSSVLTALGSAPAVATADPAPSAPLETAPVTPIVTAAVTPVETTVAVAPTPEKRAPFPPTRIATEPVRTVETPATPVDAAARTELAIRLRAAGAAADRARQNLATMRDSLASRGQTLRSDADAAMTEADRLIEDAKSSLDTNELETAEDYLRRAEFQLRKVFQTVGG